jgi:hypothetical protein
MGQRKCRRHLTNHCSGPQLETRWKPGTVETRDSHLFPHLAVARWRCPCHARMGRGKREGLDVRGAKKVARRDRLAEGNKRTSYRSKRKVPPTPTRQNPDTPTPHERMRGNDGCQKTRCGPMFFVPPCSLEVLTL